MHQQVGARTRGRVVGAGAAVATALVVIVGGTAARADEVYPSAGDVLAANQAVVAAATQVAVLDARLAGLRNRLDSAQIAAGAAAEAYNGARVAADAAATKAATSRTAAAQARARADAADLLLSQYAAGVFEDAGPLGDMGVIFTSGPQELLDRAAGIDAVGAEQQRVLQEAQAASALAASLEAAAREAEAVAATTSAAARAAAATAGAAADALMSQTAELEHQADALTARLAALRHTSTAQEQARQRGLAAAEQAERERLERERIEREEQLNHPTPKPTPTAPKPTAPTSTAPKPTAPTSTAPTSTAPKPTAPKPTTPKPTTPKPTTPRPTQTSTPSPTTATPTPTPTATPTPPPVDGDVAAVLAYARAQLGKPYLWGGAGPNAFDCSGLTMMAWRQAGVYMSHYTGAQWRETARVPLSKLQPGDLVFYGSSGESSYHVALYVGGGQVIHAPHTGDVVRYASMYMSNLLPYGGRP